MSVLLMQAPYVTTSCYSYEAPEKIRINLSTLKAKQCPQGTFQVRYCIDVRKMQKNLILSATGFIRSVLSNLSGVQ